MTAPSSTGGRTTSGRPNSFRRPVCAQTPAVLIRVFEGTQPTWRQSPPSRGVFSMRMVRAPNCAPPAAAVNPAAPPPITPRS